VFEHPALSDADVACTCCNDARLDELCAGRAASPVEMRALIFAREAVAGGR
jgi:hypothetical protein